MSEGAPLSPANGDPAEDAAVLEKLKYGVIALRAYFIALQRYQAGTPGDALDDWLEAERQLRAEAMDSRN